LIGNSLVAILNPHHPPRHLRRLAEKYRATDGITIDPTGSGLAVRFEVPGTDVQVTVFIVQTTGFLTIWSGTGTQAQIRRARLDPALAYNYGDRMKEMMGIPKNRKEFGGNLSAVGFEEFTAAVDAFLADVRRAAAEL
jgi:hypothetical protein